MKQNSPLIKVNKVMTIRQIEKKCKDHWVIIDKPIRKKDTSTIRGNLLYYCKNKEKIEKKLQELKPKDCDFYYIGPMKEDLAYIYKHIH